MDHKKNFGIVGIEEYDDDWFIFLLGLMMVLVVLILRGAKEYDNDVKSID